MRAAALTVGSRGNLTFVATATGTVATGWNLSDGQGHVVQRSAAVRTQKVLLLAPGRYLVRIDSRDEHLDKPFNSYSAGMRLRLAVIFLAATAFTPSALSPVCTASRSSPSATS